MKGMWKIVLPAAVMALALSACEKKTEEAAPAETPAAEAPVEPAPEVVPAPEAPVTDPAAPADGMAPPADPAAPAETKEGAPTP